MKLVTFERDSVTGLGVLCPDGERVIDLSAVDSSLPRDMASFIRLGPRGQRIAAEALTAGHRAVPLDELRLCAPLPRPSKNIFCVGKNYRAHASEFHSSGFDASSGGSAVPDQPIIFTKAWTSIAGPDDTIPAHRDPTGSVDYEGELAVVIGKRGRAISRQDAMAHVYGYTIVNDVTARTLQHRHKQWFLGKSIDGFCPMGPVLLTADEVPDVGRLRLVTDVNGERRQDASVADLIFDIPTLIEVISAGITLEPGDIIATGTPEGVGIGFDPPRFLAAGDTVSITIEPIGTLRNPVG